MYVFSNPKQSWCVNFIKLEIVALLVVMILVAFPRENTIIDRLNENILDSIINPEETGDRMPRRM